MRITYNQKLLNSLTSQSERVITDNADLGKSVIVV